MRRALPFFALTIFALVACKGGDAGGAPAPAGGKDDAKYYAMEIAPITLSKGAEGVLKVVITPKDGLKWNDEFPARLAVEGDTGPVRFAKTQVKKGDPGIATTKDATTLSLPLTAEEAGDGTVQAKLNFSLCTDKVCHIFRGRELQAEVTVQ